MPSARELLKIETHQRVVDAASKMFQERGFAATTIRDIAEASNVSVGTVMTVGDKNGILVRVFDALVTSEHEQRSARALHKNSPTCSSRLLELVTPFIDRFTASPALARAYASILVSGNHTSSLFTTLSQRLVQEFTDAITISGCTSIQEAPSKAHSLYFAYIGVLFSWSARNSVDTDELASSLQETFSTICNCHE